MLKPAQQALHCQQIDIYYCHFFTLLYLKNIKLILITYNAAQINSFCLTVYA